MTCRASATSFWRRRCQPARPPPLTPLQIAAGRGYVQMVDKLLAAGADVHTLDSSMGASALHFAAQSGVTDVAQLLLEAGAFINLQSATVGLTPLINAIWSKQVGMVRFLLARGAATEIKTHLGGASAWDFVGDGCSWTAGFTNPEKEAWGREIRELLEVREEAGRCGACRPEADDGGAGRRRRCSPFAESPTG